MTNWQKMENCGNYNQKSITLAKNRKNRNRRKKSQKLINDTLRVFRTDLRERITPAEKAFQEKLSNLNFKYEFQKILKANKQSYIVDFYLCDYHIICEIDGDYHTEKIQQQKDKKRTRNLLKNNVVSKIIRFTNSFALAPGNDKIILKRLFPETNNRRSYTDSKDTRGNLVVLDKRAG